MLVDCQFDVRENQDITVFIHENEFENVVCKNGMHVLNVKTTSAIIV